MTKIFICIPWFYPAFRAGGPVQSIANMVDEFKEDVEYRIFCADTDLNKIRLENITAGEWVKYNDITQVWYAPADERSKILVEQVTQLKPDILFIVGIYSWHFTLVPLLYCKVPRKIISVRGMLHPGALTQKKLKKKFYLQVFKLMGFQNKFEFHATDEREKEFIKELMGPEVKICVAANFPRKFSRETALVKKKNELCLISIALISPMKNHLLVLQSLQDCPEKILYNIWGPVKDEQYWNNCQEQIRLLPPNIIVQYNGEAQPQDVKLWLQKAHVFILPSKSENFGHSIYEALTAGKPVITSHNTPWQYLIGENAGINAASDTAGIKNAISFFAAMGQDEYNIWSENAANYADHKFNLENTRRQYREMFFKN